MLVLASQAHWLLRIALASVFIFHGWSKVFSPAPMMGLDAWVVALVGIAEVGGSLLLLVGGATKDWITRLGGLALVPPMLGAILMVHWGRWSFVPSESHPMGGMEFQATLLLIALFFLARGNGSQAAA